MESRQKHRHPARNGVNLVILPTGVQVAEGLVVPISWVVAGAVVNVLAVVQVLVLGSDVPFSV